MLVPGLTPHLFSMEKSEKKNATPPQNFKAIFVANPAFIGNKIMLLKSTNLVTIAYFLDFFSNCFFDFCDRLNAEALTMASFRKSSRYPAAAFETAAATFLADL